MSRSVARPVVATLVAGVVAVASGTAQGSETGQPAKAEAARAPWNERGVAGDALATAWLHDLLGSEPQVTLAAYRTVVESDGEPRVRRMRAAARALPLAAALPGEDEARRHLRTLIDLGPTRDDTEPDLVLQRLRAMQDALRAFASTPLVEPPDHDLRQLLQRLNSEPWRNLESLGTRPVPSTETLERALRAAEARGDTSEAERLREDLPGARTPDPARPRVVQQRRWARDILQWELGGEHDKAARMVPAVLRRRELRPNLTLPRLEAEMASGAARGLPAAETALLERALVEARARVRAGDARGAAMLIGPALVLLRPLD